jgi:hypothetical protein
MTISLRQRGFGYLTVLMLILVLGVFLGVTYERQETVAQREKELEFLFIGNQYVDAISSYYANSPDGLNELPKSLQELVIDSRFISIKRHLRKVYADPLTGGDWGLIVDENQRVKGVYSKSNQAILQIAKFKNLQLSNSASNSMVYSNVRFEFVKQKSKSN